MADLTITVGNVQVAEEAVALEVVQVGEAVTASQPVYRSSADLLHYKADSDAADTARARGIAILPAAANGWTVIVRGGRYKPGATLVQGELYGVSTNAGMIAPLTDLTTGDVVTQLGIAEDTETLNVKIEHTEVART